MSTFEVKIQPIFIKPHPNADKLEIGNIGTIDGWQVIVAKGQYKSGDMCAYIGENAVVPDNILKSYGFWDQESDKGILSGSSNNRVRGIRLRAEFSLGIVLPLTIDPSTQKFKFSHDQTEAFEPYSDVAEFLGVTKYEPPIPVEMSGDVYFGGTSIGVNYDIENIKNHPDVLVEGEEVQVTEKIHGTFCQVCILPYTDKYHNDNHVVLVSEYNSARVYLAISSKGVGSQGNFLKQDKDQHTRNVYIRALLPYYSQLAQYDIVSPITICGEVYGNGVQDLSYGCTKGEVRFSVFDVYVGERNVGRYLNDQELDNFCDSYGLTRVPVLYRGPYSKELINEYVNGTKSLFDSSQVREGVVIKPLVERSTSILSRVVLKSINEDYLTRKGKITEFQ